MESSNNELTPETTSNRVASLSERFGRLWQLDKFTQAKDLFSENSNLFSKSLEENVSSEKVLWMLWHLSMTEDKKIKSWTTNYVETNFEAIGSKITSDGLHEANDFNSSALALNVLTNSIDSLKKGEQFEKYLRFLETNISDITSAVLSRNTQLAANLATILHYVRERNKDQGYQISNNTIYDLLFTKNMPDGSRRIFFNKLQEHNSLLVGIFVNKGFSPYFKDLIVKRDIIKSYQVREYDNDILPRLNYLEVSSALGVCADIERKIPGGSEKINKIFGITHFSRYPSELLIEQMTDWENGDKAPYGVIFGSWDDWNNNVRGSVNQETYIALKKLGFKTRAVEGKTKIEFINRQKMLREKFNKSGKFHFLIVEAHGSENGFILGKSKDGAVTIDDVPELKKELSGLYSSNMQTLFFACSMGKKGGFAEKWSDQKIESVGTNINVGPSEVKVFPRPGGLIGFWVKYPGGEIMRYPDFDSGKSSSMI